MKINLNNISETMLITLYMRATDAKSLKPILNEIMEIYPQASEIKEN